MGDPLVVGPFRQRRYAGTGGIGRPHARDLQQCHLGPRARQFGDAAAEHPQEPRVAGGCVEGDDAGVGPHIEHIPRADDHERDFSVG